MKKYLALTLAILLALSALTACGGKTDDTDNSADQTVTDTPETDTPEEGTDTAGKDDKDTEDKTPDAETPEAPDKTEPDGSETPAEPDGTETPEAPVPNTPAETPAVTPSTPSTPSTGTTTPEPSTPAGGDIVISRPDGNAPAIDQPATMPDEGVDGSASEPTYVEPDADLSKIVDAIYEKVDPGYSVGTVGVDLKDDYRLGFYTGLTDGSVLTAAVASEPMISSQAFSLVVARVADGKDAKQVAKDMLAGVNPAKWVCVSADDMTAAVSGNIVMLIMVNEYDDDIDSIRFAKAFVDLYGGETVTK